MDARQRIKLLGSFLIALQLGFPGFAYGDSSRRPHLAFVADYSADFAEPLTLATTPRECKPRYLIGPGFGIPLGLGTVIGGAVMVAVGNFEVFNTGDAKSRRDRAFIAGGSLIIGGGIAAFSYSSIKLSENRHARRRVCDSDTPWTTARGVSPIASGFVF